VAVEAVTCNEVIYPGELPMGLSTHPSHGPRSLSSTHCQPGVEPPCMCSSSSPTWAPSKGPVCNKENCHPGELLWGSVCSSCEAPIHFQPFLQPGFEFSPRAHAGPRAAVVDNEEVGLPGELFKLSTLKSSSQILAAWPRAAISPPTSILMCQVPPMSSCCGCRQSE
jgi:hypothetical protein